MIIAIEGLPCSYKTTFASCLARNTGSVVLNEVMLKHEDYCSSDLFFLQNDSLKSFCCGGYFGASLILDRYYISTFLCNYLIAEGRKIDGKFHNLFLEYKKNYNEPNLWIYMDSTLDYCLEQIKKYRDYPSDDIWMKEENLMFFKNGYDYIFSEILKPYVIYLL